jgi:hypothetical protein
MTGWEDVRKGRYEDGRMANKKRRRWEDGRMGWDEGRIKFLQSA